MPSVVVWAVSAIGAAVGGAFGAALVMGATQIATGIILGGTLAYSAAQKRKAERRAISQYNAAQVDRLVTVPSGIAPRELVMGRVRKGGLVFFRGSVGAYKEKFVMLIALAAHEIDGVEGIYLNDILVDRDVNGYVTTAPYRSTRRVSFSGPIASPNAIPGTVVDIWAGVEGASESYYEWQEEVFESKARIREYLGSPDQQAALGVIADFPTLWTLAHRARGIAYLHCEFWFDETAFPTGLPNVSAIIRGARCTDPRTGLTVWTQNPSIMMRHVLLHPQFGKRTGLTAQEDAQIVAAANACDTPHDYGAGPVPLYRSAIVIPVGSSATDALDDLAQAMAGQWAYAAGEFFVRAGVYSASVMTLTEADLAVSVRDSTGGSSQQGITISAHRARNEKFNVVNPTIWDAAQDFKQVALTPLKAQALITRDGVELVQDVAMPAVFYAPQALHISGVMMRDARDPLVIVLSFKLRVYPIQIFDVVTLIIQRYFGSTPKQFIVLGRQWSMGGMIQLKLKETSAAITQPDAAFTPQGYAQNTSLPRPWDIAPPSITLVSSGTNELRVQQDGTIQSVVRIHWTRPTDPSVVSIEVAWKPVGAPLNAWRSEAVSAEQTQATIAGATDGSIIALKIRARNSLVPSDWSVQQYHTVIGKTEPPPPFDVFDIRAQPDGTRQYHFAYTTTARPLDWAGAEIRYVPGAVASPVWATMTTLQDDRTFFTASPVERNAPLEGTWTFLCRSRDTSGNLSLPVTRTTTLSKRRSGSTYLEVTHDPLWSGTISGLVRVGGTLEAASATTWATLPTTWAAWTQWAVGPAASGVYTTVDVDLDTVITGQVDVTLQALGTPLIEIRTSNTGAITGYDDIVWGSWMPAESVFTARRLQLRITISATPTNPVATLQRLDWRVSSDIQREYLNDVVVSGLTGIYRIGTGDVRAPIANTYILIRNATATVQDSRSGSWTVTRVDKSPAGPRFRFFLNGVLTDPQFTDFDIEGI